MRSKKAALNFLTSLLLQIITAVCGFIVPRLILNTFGSSVNGLIGSISQFLGYIVLLEAGVGGVVRAALYGPLAEHDIGNISGIIKATEKFFKKIAYIFLGYMFIFAIIFPYLKGGGFGYPYVFCLVLIIGMSTFSQYYFGITYQVLLQADQKTYITSSVQVMTTIVNTILIWVLIKYGASIHVVRIGSMLVFFTRPIILRLYVRSRFQLDRNCAANDQAIKQRWDGFGHHIAFFLHSSTAVVVLTLFSTFKEVSVFTVHFMIISSVKSLATTVSHGFEAAMGNMIAKEEDDALNRNFRIYESIVHITAAALFTTTALTITPFISVYIHGVTDVNYYRPAFAYLLTLGEALYCIRLPYHSVVVAAGHFKQTRNGAFAEAFINIAVSAVAVHFWGIIGVAIGTVCATLFRTTQYAYYLRKNIINRKFNVFIKRGLISVMIVCAIVLSSKLIPSTGIDSYASWSLYAVQIAFMAFFITILANLIFYKKDMKNIFESLKRIIAKKR